MRVDTHNIGKWARSFPSIYSDGDFVLGIGYDAHPSINWWRLIDQIDGYIEQVYEITYTIPPKRIL